MSQINKRLVAKVSVFDGIAYQTNKYKPNIYLGDPINICNILSDQGCQEINLVFPYKKPPLNKLKKILSVARSPIAIGGYGTDEFVIEKILTSGAEKVILSDSILKNPKHIENLSKRFGEQAISLSLDYIIYNNNRFIVSGNYRDKKEVELIKFLNNLPSDYFGELILSCVSNDGFNEGLDFEIQKIFNHSKPILMSGGYDGSNISDIIYDGIVSSSNIFLYGGILHL